MAHAISTEQLVHEVRHMLGQLVFNNTNATQQEVFGHLDSASFTAAQAAEYLEVSLPTLRRYVQSNNLAPKAVVGRSQLFAARDLQAFKRSLREAKR